MRRESIKKTRCQIAQKRREAREKEKKITLSGGKSSKAENLANGKDGDSLQRQRPERPIEPKRRKTKKKKGRPLRDEKKEKSRSLQKIPEEKKSLLSAKRIRRSAKNTRKLRKERFKTREDGKTADRGPQNAQGKKEEKVKKRIPVLQEQIKQKNAGRAEKVKTRKRKVMTFVWSGNKTKDQ